jgi:hypothetical protein
MMGSNVLMKMVVARAATAAAAAATTTPVNIMREMDVAAATMRLMILMMKGKDVDRGRRKDIRQ